MEWRDQIPELNLGRRSVCRNVFVPTHYTIGIIIIILFVAGEHHRRIRKGKEAEEGGESVG